MAVSSNTTITFFILYLSVTGLKESIELLAYFTQWHLRHKRHHSLSEKVDAHKHIDISQHLIVTVTRLSFSGNEAKLQFYLNNYTDSSSLISAIRAIHYDGGNTNTTGGLRTMRLEIFDTNHGDRLTVNNLCILITDGVPTREVEGLQDEVNRVKAAGIRVIGVGVTSAVSDFEQFLRIRTM